MSLRGLCLPHAVTKGCNGPWDTGHCRWAPPQPLPAQQGWDPITGIPQVTGEAFPQPVVVTWSARDGAMRYLNIFTAGELVAVTILVLQLILVAAVLRDKRLWRIRQHWKQPRAAIARLEEQSSLDRAQKSAEVSPGSSRQSSMNYRKQRFIQSSQDTWVLFEEQHRELEAQLARQQYRGGDCRVLQTEMLVELPGLLGGRESPQCLAVELPGPDMNKGAEEAKRKTTGQCSRDYTTLQRRRSMARLLPRLVVIVNPTVLESCSSSSSSSTEVEYSSTTTGWFLGKLRARLQRYLEASQTHFVQRRRGFCIHLRSQWWWRCWTQRRKGRSNHE
ncbi:uncharacterized protein LOC114069907 [Empidonax traillii]|uniref:uncharacterized protein LOC114069907 n=1 Tax=Empidonax traillii TaxID=164674 RepID=UPI000FFDB418|nr:uncharacterized protein LOC114069907 [Empidonax traillii]